MHLVFVTRSVDMTKMLREQAYQSSCRRVYFHPAKPLFLHNIFFECFCISLYRTTKNLLRQYGKLCDKVFRGLRFGTFSRISAGIGQLVFGQKARDTNALCMQNRNTVFVI